MGKVIVDMTSGHVRGYYRERRIQTTNQVNIVYPTSGPNPTLIIDTVLPDLMAVASYESD